MKEINAAFQNENGQYLIEIRLADIDQFFNTLDHSPFHSKDIDDDAERYIVESVRTFPLPEKLKLVFYLPQEHHAEAAEVLPYAIDNFFEFKATMADRELRSLLLEGRMTLVNGLSFLIVCISLRFAFGFISSNPAGYIFLEGLSIIGWVAMWRPVQTFLYDWWPILRKKKIYKKIQDLPIEICLD